MKYVTSVSKIYKHRGIHYHRSKTKRYWHIIGYEYDDYEERLKMFCEQVSWIKAMYYKGKKFKKFHLPCPNCRKTYMVLVRKEKDLEKQDCPDCFENFKDLYEEYAENLENS